MQDQRTDRLAELEQGLLDVSPGLRLVDRDLSIGGELMADLVGIDAAGRLTLVRLCEDDGVNLVLLTLDTLARVSACIERLAVHLNTPSLRTDLDAHLVLVAERFTPQTLQRLGPLASGPVGMYEFHELQTATTKAIFLVPVEPRARQQHAAPKSNVEGFIPEMGRREPEDLLEVFFFQLRIFLEELGAVRVESQNLEHAPDG